MEKLGMTETKELVSFILSLGNGIGASLEDGKIGVSDVSNFFGAMTLAGPALSGVNAIPGELSDMDDAEKEDLLAFVNEKFDIPQDNIEASIERSLRIGVDIAALIADFKTKE